MTVAWPGTVPQYAMVSGYQERPERNVVEFRPETGPPLTRRRTSVSSDIISFETLMTLDEYDDLLEFYRYDLKDGSLTFKRKHPRNILGADKTFKFIAEPEMRPAGPTFATVAMQMRLMPV